MGNRESFEPWWVPHLWKRSLGFVLARDLGPELHHLHHRDADEHAGQPDGDPAVLAKRSKTDGCTGRDWLLSLLVKHGLLGLS